MKPSDLPFNRRQQLTQKQIRGEVVTEARRMWNLRIRSYYKIAFELLNRNYNRVELEHMALLADKNLRNKFYVLVGISEQLKRLGVYNYDASLSTFFIARTLEIALVNSPSAECSDLFLLYARNLLFILQVYTEYSINEVYPDGETGGIAVGLEELISELESP